MFGAYLKEFVQVFLEEFLKIHLEDFLQNPPEEIYVEIAEAMHAAFPLQKSHKKQLTLDFLKECLDKKSG